MIRISRTGRHLPINLALWCILAIGSTRMIAAEIGEPNAVLDIANVGATGQTANPTDMIDASIRSGWQQAGVQPSAVCDDATFIRRLYLDLMGRVPTSAEQHDFLTNSDADKRATWADRLLESPAYARHMAEVFDAMLMGRPSNRAAARRAEHGWPTYLEDSFAANRPWNQMARDIVLARATDQTDVRASWFLYERRNAHQEIAEAVAPTFFGIRIECAQCHDHPLASEIQQAHYWGLVAFFNRSENKETDPGPRVVETASGGAKNYTDLAGDSHEMLLTFFESPVVDEPRLTDAESESQDDYIAAEGAEPGVPKFSRRQQFADQVLADHPLLARSFVNRIWALLVGRGFVHPHDRMDSMHPASHPELLDWLADDFRASGYDIKRLIRQIVGAQCYQLESRPSDDQARPEHFAYALTKPLTAESLLRSVCTVLRGEPTEPDADLLKEFRETFPDILPEEPTSTLSQALLLTNHAQFNRLFDVSTSPVLAEVVELPTASAQVERAFQVALGRDPEPDERAQAVSFVSSHGASATGVAQLMWALLTSAEFRVNH